MVKYPTNPQDWQEWMKTYLGIPPERGISLLYSDSFPLDELIDLWKVEFSTEKGYVADFIPALVRNKNGLLRWVYLDEPEPDWRGSDNQV